MTTERFCVSDQVDEAHDRSPRTPEPPGSRHPDRSATPAPR
jgi:hypothetical protein